MSDPIDRDAIQARVRAIVSEVLSVPLEDVRPESRFIEDLGADSFDNFSLLVALEEEVDTEISEEEVDKLMTVGSAVDLVERLLSQRDPSRRE